MTATGNGGAATDVPLGALRIEEDAGNLTASIAFNLAYDTPPGEYWIMVCNDPCTTGIGDLIGGVIYVGVDPPSPTEELEPVAAAGLLANPEPPAQKAVSLRLGPAPTPTRPDQFSPIWIGISAALGGAVLIAALASRQRA